MDPEQHFDLLCQKWAEFILSTRDYLRDLDGDTSRKIGRIVFDAQESENWIQSGTARFLKSDTFIWNELANSRKR